MATMRSNAMLVLGYLYERGGGYVISITGGAMRRGFPKMDKRAFDEALQFLAFAHYVEGASAEDEGHYFITASGVDVAEHEFQQRSFFRRKRDDLWLLVLGVTLGTATTLLATLVTR